VKQNTLVSGVPNLVKTPHAPRHTAEARTGHTHLSKPIEANIEKGESPLALSEFQKCVKFGVHFTKQVAVLQGFGVGLQLICADGFNSALVQNNGDVLLGTGNLQAQGVRNPQQTLNLFRVHIKNGLRDISPTSRKGGCSLLAGSASAAGFKLSLKTVNVQPHRIHLLLSFTLNGSESIIKTAMNAIRILVMRIIHLVDVFHKRVQSRLLLAKHIERASGAEEAVEAKERHDSVGVAVLASETKQSRAAKANENEQGIRNENRSLVVHHFSFC
jgi:hypothetical protein